MGTLTLVSMRFVYIFIIIALTITFVDGKKTKRRKTSRTPKIKDQAAKAFLKAGRSETWITLRDEMANEQKLFTGADWENRKEEFESSEAYDFEVDKFEVCISECQSRDESADLIGVGYEENLEDFGEGKLTKKPLNMCLECFEAWPASKISN